MEEKKKRGVGSPRRFASGEEFFEEFKKYVNDCDVKGKIPSIVGFSVFSLMTRQTYYQTKDYYPFEFEMIECMIEDETFNNKSTHPSLIKHALNNKCGWRDRQEIDNTVNFNDGKLDDVLKAFKE